MIASERTHQWYKNGQWQNWNAYRYGKSTTKKPRPIYKKDARERVMAFTLLYLKQWRLSPFEYEGAAVAGLRAALCKKGYSWDRSDAEAISIVNDCLRQMGAERPSWYDGQREYVAPRTNCMQCGGWLDEQDQAESRRFCSSECAKGLLTFRAEWTDKRSSLAYIFASQEYRERNAPGRPCKGCGKTFHSTVKDRDYCSQRCHYNSMRSQEERPCAYCGELFYSNVASTRCCSLRCDGILKAQKMRESAPEQSCPICRSIFRPSRVGQLYCSNKCARSPAVRAEQYLRRKNGTNHVEALCPCCCVKFVTSRSSSTYCSAECGRFVARINGGAAPKKIAPLVFDYYFKQAA